MPPRFIEIKELLARPKRKDGEWRRENDNNQTPKKKGAGITGPTVVLLREGRVHEEPIQQFDNG